MKFKSSFFKFVACIHLWSSFCKETGICFSKLSNDAILLNLIKNNPNYEDLGAQYRPGPDSTISRNPESPSYMEE